MSDISARFVAEFQGDIPAPVSAQVKSGPGRKAQAGDGEAIACPLNHRAADQFSINKWMGGIVQDQKDSAEQ